ncbi:MAG TPA: type 2 isopentenyl-diphosphate Delta-isomerase [Methanothrix sp.]|nr:type 2 isopentenyl-diphosphate Delta-isomerase [Methanothrix sp.]HPJ85020.1 type 2 isopentenyl-diphosphate Delta-isomerase [Methanothrix sp.]HPR66409.1 type 2 isopentenyl-diphosphate Delta-isomerase [Methanothrix sp.]
MTTGKRKLDHIRICIEKTVEGGWRPLDDLALVHRALPGIDASEIDTRCRFLGRDLAFPFMISGMTGGHPDTKEINVNLALAAQEVGVALGVGSQRAALEHPDVEETFSAVRDAAPKIPIVGNIGAVQLKRMGPEVIDRLAEMIDADAIAVHLNFLQESVQPEGETEARGAIEAIRSAADGRVPIIAKETGAGICGEDARALVEAGVEIIDVGGLGGTSWSGVEAYRAEERDDLESARMGRLFWRWGVPTTVSVVECASAGAQVVSSGGVRSGIEVATSIALGASLAGAALPFLAPATEGSSEVADLLRVYKRAFRTAMFLTASKNVSDLRSAPIVVLGRTREILEQRGFDSRKFSIYREMSR